MLILMLLPFAVQMLVVNFDEFYFHVRRGLPKWERLGHPLDTLTVLACFVFVLWVPYSLLSLKVYIALALFSCIFVTKDEFVHKDCCPASEQWLHALLFLNHPIVLASAGLLWPIIQGVEAPAWLAELVPHADNIKLVLSGQALCITLFFCYQTIYWNFLWKDKLPE